MKNISFKKILLSFGLLFSLVAFNSCIDPNSAITEDSILSSNIAAADAIIGTWTGTYPGESYTITSTTFVSAGSYEGNNLYIKKLTNTSGYLYFKYTKAADSNWNYTTDPAQAPDVGKWYAVSYKNLTANSITLAGAYKADGQTSCTSLEAAVAEFTIEHGYYATYSTCVRTAVGSGTIPDISTYQEEQSNQGETSQGGAGEVSQGGTGETSQTEPEGTVIATTYLSNFSGNYSLASGLTLNVGAKINISQNVSHYWNANVVNPSYDEETKTYSFLLAHSSQQDASGSIDPGITGQEPFISQQGLFWSRMTLTANPGSQWEIKWSSVWVNSMEAANGLTLDKTDCFTGPATSSIHYSYKFFFAEPKLVNGFYTVDKGSSIYETEFDSALPVDKTWQQIYNQYDIASKINLPQGKSIDYWWYTTNSLTGIQENYAFELTDTFKPSLYEFEFYLALKDEVSQNSIYVNPGIFYNAEKGLLVIENDSISWNYKKYSIVDGVQWSEAGKSTTNPKLPMQYCYLVSDGTSNYYCLVEYYVNNGFTYNKFRLPKETSDTVITSEKNNWDLFGEYTSRNYLEKQTAIPKLYFTRSAFWMGSGSPYSSGDETSDNSNYCYFILNDENTITWVTYPVVEDEDYGDEYRERHEYELKKRSNGLWELNDSVSDADSEDYETTVLSMMDYITGIELIFNGNTISVDYQGYLEIKEWYTRVNSEPQSQRYIY